MAQILYGPQPTDSSAEAHRDAYNAAFEELGLNWHWDADTFARLPANGRDALRAYLQNEHPHLLRAYDADFLVDAIEAVKARFYAAMAGKRTAVVARRTAALQAHAHAH